jgi:xanthine dehydrogenase accessory factor
MRQELIRLAAQLAERGEAFAWATVVARRAPSSARVGDACIVTARGAFHGFAGGSCTRPSVIEQSLRSLQDGEPRLIVLSPDPEDATRPGAAVFPMTCHSGGSVEIHIQPVLPAPRLLVYGLTPAARALVRLGAAMGYHVFAIDPGAEPSTFPEAEAVVTDPGAVPAAGERDVLAVVATQGEWDEEALLSALAQDPAYLGFVASAKRAEELRELLAAKLSAEQRARLARLRAPAGLRIGARSGEEIAVSIIAEIVEARRAARSRTLPVAAAPAAEQAIDPVCGMSVAVASARHRSEHAGRSYYFCCAGCREKFEREAERFVAAAEGRG